MAYQRPFVLSHGVLGSDKRMYFVNHPTSHYNFISKNATIASLGISNLCDYQNIRVKLHKPFSVWINLSYITEIFASRLTVSLYSIRFQHRSLYWQIRCELWFSEEIDKMWLADYAMQDGSQLNAATHSTESSASWWRAKSRFSTNTAVSFLT